MKRDWKLLKEIMMAIEEDRIEDFFQNGGNDTSWKQDKYQDEIEKELKSRQRLIDRHILLLIDARLISVINSHVVVSEPLMPVLSLGASYSYDLKSLELSMSGFDLLEHMRSKKVWSKIQEVSAKIGEELTVDGLKKIIPFVIASCL